MGWSKSSSRETTTTALPLAQWIPRLILRCVRPLLPLAPVRISLGPTLPLADICWKCEWRCTSTYIQGVPKKIVHKKTKGHRVKPALGAYSTRNSKMFSLWALLETISFSRWKWPLKFEKIGSHISTQKISRVIIRGIPYSTLKIMNISLRASLCSCLFRWWKS